VSMTPGRMFYGEKRPGAPTFNFDFAANNLIKVSSTYYAVGQNFGGFFDTNTIRIASTSDLTGTWTDGGTILQRSDVSWLSAGNGVYGAHIIENGGTFYLFFSTGDASPITVGKIGVATATTVTGPYTDSGAAILDVGGGGAWDSRRVGEPSVVLSGGTWYMAYMGETSAATFEESEKIGIASASSPTGTWTKYGSNPIIGFGTAGTWDGALCADPHMWLEDGWWWIMYAGGADSTPTSGAYQGLAYASTPLGSWTKHEGNPIMRTGLPCDGFDRIWVFRGGVFSENGIRHGVFTGYNGSVMRSSYFRLWDWPQHIRRPT
jgi:beta-xylosidase